MNTQQLTAFLLAILLIGTQTTYAFKPNQLSKKEDNPIENGLEEIQCTGSKKAGSIIVDLQYKKSENITGKPLYPKKAIA